MAKARIGFVGTGNMGQMAHLRNYVYNESCEVVALAEVRVETGKLVAERYGIKKVYRDHHEMLAHEQLDGIVASQPFDRHALLIPELYGKVRCVFTEKPLSIGLEAGATLVRAAAEKHTIHMVGYHKRADPATAYAVHTIGELKQSKRLGKLRYIRICMPAGDWVANGLIGCLNARDKYPSFDRETPPSDMDAETAKHYVAFVNYYIHQVNLLRYLLGESYHLTFVDKSDVLLVAESASGITATIEMSPYRTTIEWEESALIAFEKGYLELRLPAPLAHNRAGSVVVYEDPGDGAVPQRIQPTMPWLHAMRGQAERFVQVCLGQAQPFCEAAEALEDLKVAREFIRLRYGK